MIRVDIETIIMAAGPVPSAIVLRERAKGTASEAPLRSLSIQTGTFEAASIGRGLNHVASERPITHDLMIDVIGKLGARLERVEIDRVDPPVFGATLVLARGEAAPAAATTSEPEATAASPLDTPASEIRVDARPSDALALAVRAGAPVYVEDDVMNREGSISYHQDTSPDETELERFDAFVQTLSPDDF